MRKLVLWACAGCACAAPMCTTLRIRALNNTGTIVNDSTRLASSETITDTDSGENRYFAVPSSRNTGTKTIQMHSVESIVGTPTSPAPRTMAV